MPVTKAVDVDELWATLDPDIVKHSDALRQLTRRELIVLIYVLALAQDKGKGSRRIRMPKLYEMLRLTTSGGVNSRDYDRLEQFVFKKADRLKIWEVFEDDEGDYIRFYNEFWKPNFRPRPQVRGIKGHVKADVDLLRRLKTPTEVLLALLIEASVNRPGR